MSYKEKLKEAQKLSFEVEEKVKDVIRYICESFTYRDLTHPLGCMWNYEIVSMSHHVNPEGVLVTPRIVTGKLSF